MVNMGNNAKITNILHLITFKIGAIISNYFKISQIKQYRQMPRFKRRLTPNCITIIIAKSLKMKALTYQID